MVDPIGLGIGIILIYSLLIIWILIWKGIGLWVAARNKQIVWFILILILATLGILPIIYLIFFRRKR